MKSNANEKHLTYFNILDAMKTGGCPICFLLEKAAHGYMDNLLYEHVNDSGVRKKIRDSEGFCNLHSWPLQKFRDGFGLGIIYNDLLEIVCSNLQKALNKKGAGLNSIGSGHDGKSKPACPICIYLNKTGDRYLSTFLEYFNDEEFNTAFKKSFGLCLPHYMGALRCCGDDEIKRELTIFELKKIESLKFELSEFLQKHDYRFSH